MTNPLIMSLIVVLLILLQTALRKFVFKEKLRRISDSPGNKINLWGNGLLALAAVVIAFFVLDMTDHNTAGWFYLTFFIAIMGFHTFVEWRYLKGSKEYIITLVSFAIGLTLIFIFVF